MTAPKPSCKLCKGIPESRCKYTGCRCAHHSFNPPKHSSLPECSHENTYQWNHCAVSHEYPEGMKMNKTNLPEMFSVVRSTSYEAHLIESLAIAWEALEFHGSKEKHQTCGHCSEALRRIEELGKPFPNDDPPLPQEWHL